MSVIDPTEYVIRTRFDVQSQVPGLSNVSNQITRIEAAVGGLGRNITGNLMGALGVLGSTIGLGLAVRQVVTLNAEMENARFGIAALFSVMQATPMPTALERSTAVVAQLRKDAAEGVGELQDYVTGFQRILGPGLASGGSVQDLMKLNRMAIAAGAASGQTGGMAYATMDVVQALRRGADDRVTPFVIQALTAAGIGKDKFNAMSQPDRLKALFEGFGKYQAAAVAYGSTWDARMATFRDKLKDIFRYGTNDLFKTWSDDLAAANLWLTANQDVIRDTAQTIARDLVGAWKALKETGIGLMSGGAGATAGMVGGRLAMALGAGGPTGMLAGGIIAFLTAAVGQAIGRFPDLGARLTAAFGDLFSAFGGLFDAVMRLVQTPAVGMIGTVFLEILVVLTKFATVIVRVAEMMATTVETYARTLDLGLRGIYALTKGNFGEAMLLRGQAAGVVAAAPYGRFEEQLKGLFDFTAAGGANDPYRRLGDPADFNPAVTPPPVNNFNGPVTVKVQAERLDDPNMVATTFEAIMRRLAEYPTTVRGGSGRLVPKPL